MREMSGLLVAHTYCRAVLSRHRSCLRLFKLRKCPAGAVYHFPFWHPPLLPAGQQMLMLTPACTDLLHRKHTEGFNASVQEPQQDDSGDWLGLKNGVRKVLGLLKGQPKNLAPAHMLGSSKTAEL